MNDRVSNILASYAVNEDLYLLRTIKRLEDHINILKKTLTFYAEGHIDSGHRAREALKKIKDL